MRPDRRIDALVVLGCAALVACQSRRPIQPARAAHYTIGAPWSSAGYWFYPREQLSYEATGLAIVDAPSDPRGRRTADGERYEPQIAAGAHQTLQLPVVLRVRNLQNGREMLLRIDDRGPALPGRVLSVTPRAAELLGMIPGRATPVRLIEEQAPSRYLLGRVEGSPAADVVAAPVGQVEEQSLMPGAPPSATSRSTSPPSDRPEPDASALPDEAVTVAAPEAWSLWIDAGQFSAPGYARRLALQLDGSVRQSGRGRSSVFSVRIGPFDQVGDADAALDRARSAGVTGARIIVE